MSAPKHDPEQTTECGLCGASVETVDENGECEECAEDLCDYCKCVCMGDKRCIMCSGKCTCSKAAK